MKPNSIENLYQRIFVCNENVYKEEANQLYYEIQCFVRSQLLKRDVDSENELFDELLEVCNGAVLETMSKHRDEGFNIMPYLTTVIHNNISSTFHKHYNASDQYIFTSSLEVPIQKKGGETFIIDEVEDENASFENDMLQKLGQKYLARHVYRDYSSKREFDWIMKESQGYSDMDIAKQIHISNSYVGRQKRAVKKEIKLKYSNEYHNIMEV